MEEARYHKCSICCKIILCETVSIMLHLKFTHNIRSKSKYFRRLEDARLARVAAGKHEGAVMIGCSVRLPRIQVKHMQGNIKAKNRHRYLDLTGAKLSSEVGNLCRFKCTKCGDIFGTFSRLMAHRKQCAPHMTTALTPDVMVEIVAHQCALCPLIFLCDKRVIGDHLRIHHSMNIATYLQATRKEEIKSEQQIESENRLERLRKQVPTVPAGDTTLLPASAVPRDKVTFMVEPLCRFRCPVCHHESSTMGSFFHHMASKRCLGPNHRTRGFRAEFCKEARYHLCCICAKRYESTDD